MTYHKKGVRKYRDNNPEKMQLHWRKRALRRYGLTLADYDRMVADQNGRCAICQTDTPGGPGGRFAVDHDHESGEVRGLLCSRCNFVIGYAKENIETLARAIEYIRRFKD